MASGDAQRLTPPWQGRPQREDKAILGLMALAGLLPLALTPLIPALVASTRRCWS
jgi:hypothetical protein